MTAGARKLPEGTRDAGAPANPGAAQAAPVGVDPLPNAGAPPWLRGPLDFIDALGRFSGSVAALALAALTLLILSEITVRLLSNYIPGLPAGIPTAWEVSSYLMGIAFMTGSAMALRAGSHIRVSLLLAQLPPGGRQAIEIASSLVGFLLTAFLFYSLTMFSWASFDRGQTSIASDIPLWIPEAAITFGAGVLCLQMLARTVQAICDLPLEDERLKVAAPGE